MLREFLYLQIFRFNFLVKILFYFSEQANLLMLFFLRAKILIKITVLFEFTNQIMMPDLPEVFLDSLP
jgi:hypothetical protein